MSAHSHYEELTALAAGGHLSDEELSDLQRHEETCSKCKDAAGEFRKLAHLVLPLAQNRFHRIINMFTNRPDPGATQRFIRRASLEGIGFSQDVKAQASSHKPRLSLAVAGAGILSVLAVAFLYGSYRSDHTSLRPEGQNSAQVQQQLAHLLQQNTALEARISQQQHELAARQHESEDLRAQVAILADNSRHDNDQTRPEAIQLASYREEAETQRKIQEKLLSDTRGELARLNQARASDQASIVADQIHINEMSEELKAARANTSNTQRQLVAASGDASNLMGARQLHVVDVRDTDPNGRPGKAFGRVFLTEGKSLVFYAFDLNDLIKNGGKKTFQVWGQQGGKSGSLRSLGFLNLDNKTQRRWALKTNDAAAFKEINSLFVTVEPQGGATTPSGQRLLFAYLGEANHP
jgi:hypothetical protein